MQAFSPAARDIFERFDFHAQVERLAKANLLYLATEKFANIDLHPTVVDNAQMGLVFEELIRKFAEDSNETAGEHFTPREVIRLMVNLLFIEDDDVLTPGNAVVRTIYDPTAGTGGMLSIAGEHLLEHNPAARLTMFGQELNDESYAICKADMLIKDQDVTNIVAGNIHAEGLHDERTVQAAKDVLDALVLFKNDIGAFNRLYAFLSQIFDYGNTDIEKRFLFFKRLIPLLEFGRERDMVDLSKIVLTHHNLRNAGRQPLNLGHGQIPKLPPMDAVGSGSVQDKQQAFLDEIIEKVNGLFEGDLSDDDQLVYVNGVIKGKLLDNDTLLQQAMSNSKEQFANSPDLKDALLHAIMDAFEAHSAMQVAVNNKRGHCSTVTPRRNGHVPTFNLNFLYRHAGAQRIVTLDWIAVEDGSDGRRTVRVPRLHFRHFRCRAVRCIGFIQGLRTDGHNLVRVRKLAVSES